MLLLNVDSDQHVRSLAWGRRSVEELLEPLIGDRTLPEHAPSRVGLVADRMQPFVSAVTFPI